MRLNELADKAGARRPRKRIGRGIGSGTGKTGGRGVKGQKSRSGVAIKGFEGGQMPIYRRLPKRGFNNPNSKNWNIINLGQIEDAIKAKKLDGKKPVNMAALIAAGIIGKPRDGVRLLGQGELKSKVTFEIDHASKSAIAAVEKAGGKVTILVKSLDEEADTK
ncbi:LSU ribosomal protein L15p (L27Ae) [hydrothermal vent metagenome]|uniref:LSU ribosomal protein L15p (L27Ae) n=1 Tax=hydrothermal vent metagenome TaxID=652676 RepID=A0A3B0RIM3_9ZZZZ